MASDDDPHPLAGCWPLAEAAPRLDVNTRTLKRMIYDGRIAAIKHAGRLYIADEELEDYVARLKAQGAKRRASYARRHRSNERAAAG